MAPIEPLILTKERAARLWTQLAEFPAWRQQMGMATEAGFWAVLGDKHNLFVDIAGGAGLVSALQVRPGHDATVYFMAFDHELRGKEPLFLAAVGYLFTVGQLRRVTAYTPDDMTVVLKLLRRLGFRWEGVLRQGWAWDAQVGDVHVNGLLREEWDAGVAAAA